MTQAEIDALRAAINSGVKTVTYADGSRVDYRDLDQMREILRAMQADMAGGAQVARPLGGFRVMPTSGY